MKKSILFSFMLFSFAAVAQTTHTVDNSNSSGAQFTAIQDAIDSAEPGDTIYIHPSPVSYGSITVNKVIHLRGLGHSPQYTNGMSATMANITLNAPIGAQGITLSGLDFSQIIVSGTQNYNNLEVTNCKIAKIAAGSGNGQCDNWVIAGCVMVGLNFDNFRKQNSNGWMVVNNHIRQPGTSASWGTFRDFNGSDVVRNNIIVTHQTNSDAVIFQDCVNLNVENSIILFTNTATGINLSGNSITFNNCLTYHYPGLTLPALNGNNNLDNTDPMFVDIGSNPNFSSDKNFHLQEVSPGAEHGTDGQDIGLYGSSFPFNMYGYPADLPYPTYMEITNSVVGQGGTLNVVFEAVGN